MAAWSPGRCAPCGNAGAIDRDARITHRRRPRRRGLARVRGRARPLWLTDVTQTHEPAAIVAATQGSRFVAINGAVEVDLFGQVNAERAAGTIQAGAGGLPAFAQAAMVAPGGTPLDLPRVDLSKQGSVSRIVPALGDASLCTLPRHLADAVVTEHGVAELRGLGLDARAEALIAVAARAPRRAGNSLATNASSPMTTTPSSASVDGAAPPGWVPAADRRRLRPAQRPALRPLARRQARARLSRRSDACQSGAGVPRRHAGDARRHPRSRPRRSTRPTSRASFCRRSSCRPTSSRRHRSAAGCLAAPRCCG